MAISNESKKLVISNPNLLSILIGSIICLPPLISGIFLTIFVITEPLILKSSKLNCIRDNGEVVCSLTGSHFFANIEKVFSSKNGELIKANVQDRNGINNVLVIATKNKEILLYTQTEIVERQAFELNSFLRNQNPLQTTVHIQTNKSSDYSDLLFLIPFTIFWNFIVVNMYIIVIRYIFNRKKYIFDKEVQELIILRSFRKKVLFKISIQIIRQIQLKKIDNKPKIYFLDEFNSILFFIDNLNNSTANKLVKSTSLFLQIEPIKVIEKDNPP